MRISRRTALTGATAAVAATIVPTAAVATTEPEDPVLVLKREWEARYNLIPSDPDASDEYLEPFYRRVDEIEDRILQTPATTSAGVVVKLVLWARQHCESGCTTGLSWNHESIEGRALDLDRLPVISALNDLERLAGEARP